MSIAVVMVSVLTELCLGVKSMPTFKFFRDGKELDTIVGWNQNKVMGILEKESSSL